MELPRIRPTRAEVDLGALVRNVRTLKAAAPGAGLLAVVKANAYGHGAALVAPTLEAEGVALLGVALIEEGLTLRAAGVRTEILAELVDAGEEPQRVAEIYSMPVEHVEQAVAFEHRYGDSSRAA